MLFSWPVFVYYEDTDVGGVVYHANYLKFFERARTQWFQSLGLNQTKLMAEDVCFVVKKADIDFRVPARFEQQLTVESTISTLKKASMTFSQRLLDKDGLCYCEAQVIVACISLSKMRPRALPANIVQEFDSAR